MVAPAIAIPAVAGAVGVGGTALGSFIGGSGGGNKQEQRPIQKSEQVTKKDTTNIQRTFSPQTTISPQTNFDKTFSPSINLGSEGVASTQVKKQTSQSQKTAPSNRQTSRQRNPTTTRPVQNPSQQTGQKAKTGDTGQTLAMMGLIAGGSYVALEVLGGDE